MWDTRSGRYLPCSKPLVTDHTQNINNKLQIIKHPRKLVLILPTSERWQVQSTPPGINSTVKRDLNSGPSDPKPTTLTIKPTTGYVSKNQALLRNWRKCLQHMSTTSSNHGTESSHGMAKQQKKPPHCNVKKIFTKTRVSLRRQKRRTMNFLKCMLREVCEPP